MQELVEERYITNQRTGTTLGYINWAVTVRESLELHRFPFDRQVSRD